MALPSITLVPTATAAIPTTLQHIIRQTTAAASAAITEAPLPTGTFISDKYITIGGITNEHVTIPAKTITLALPTCIQTLTPDANGYLPPGTCNSLWEYYPSFSAALAFTFIFAILVGAHVFQAARYKKPFCWVVIMAAIWETLAYLFRTISTRNQGSTGILIIFQIFILLAPLWVNAFGYMILGRMIYYFIPSRKIFGIPAATLAAGFVTLDFVAFIVQLVGGSTAGPTAPPEQKLNAIHIYMGGIGLQQAFIVIFIVFAVKFQLEMRRVDANSAVIGGKTPQAYDAAAMAGLVVIKKTGWFPLLLTLYASLTFITIRIIFRLVEFSSGSTGMDNPIVTNESYFYALEGVPMILALLSFNVVHPGRILVGPESEMPGFFKTIFGRCCGGKNKRGGANVNFNKLEDSDREDDMLPLRNR